MRNFLLGVVVGAVGYHYISSEIDKQELIAEMRDLVHTVDEKLAAEQQSGSKVVQPTEEEAHVKHPEGPGESGAI